MYNLVNPETVRCLTLHFHRVLAVLIGQFCFEKPKHRQLCDAEFSMIKQEFLCLKFGAVEVQGCDPSFNFYLPYQSHADYTMEYTREQRLQTFKNWMKAARKVFRVARLKDRSIDATTIVRHSWIMHCIHGGLFQDTTGPTPGDYRSVRDASSPLNLHQFCNTYPLIHPSEARLLQDVVTWVNVF
jgi:hypothetical protein